MRVGLPSVSTVIGYCTLPAALLGEAALGYILLTNQVVKPDAHEARTVTAVRQTTQGCEYELKGMFRSRHSNECYQGISDGSVVDFTERIDDYLNFQIQSMSVHGSVVAEADLHDVVQQSMAAH